MAVGRKDKQEAGPPVAGGHYGRLQAPPKGTMYVRDAGASQALAVRQAIATFEAAGVAVPENLTRLAEGLKPVEDADDVILVDAVTGEFIVDVDVIQQGEEPESEFVEQADEAGEEEAGEEGVEQEAEEDEEVPVEALTVEQLKDELDGWGVEYGHGDRKPDLQEKLREARASGE
jgi:hypothetical protein